MGTINTFHQIWIHRCCALDETRQLEIIAQVPQLPRYLVAFLIILLLDGILGNGLHVLHIFSYDFGPTEILGEKFELVDLIYYCMICGLSKELK